MDWRQILTEIIISILGIVLTAVSGYVMAWISSKIKDEKMKRILNEALQTVSNGVDFVYQTYVEGLKGTSLWDENAMKEASNRAMEYITANLTEDAKAFISKNGKDLAEWIKEQIEIAIQKSKRNK